MVRMCFFFALGQTSLCQLLIMLLRAIERMLYTSFFIPAVLQCTPGFDRGCQVTAGCGRHLGLTDTPGLDLMLVTMPDNVNL